MTCDHAWETAFAAGRRMLARGRAEDLSATELQVMLALAYKITSHGRTSDTVTIEKLAAFVRASELETRAALKRLHELGVIDCPPGQDRTAPMITLP